MSTMLAAVAAIGFALLTTAAGVSDADAHVALTRGAGTAALHRSLQSDASVRYNQFEQSTTAGLIDISFSKSVQPSVVEMATSVAGHTTFQLVLTPVGKAETVYTIYGQEKVHLVMPPAFQSPAPFGTNTGGSSSAFWKFAPDCQHDSYLLQDPYLLAAATVSSVGIEFTEWTANTGINSADGAVFFMNPSAAPAGPAVVAQLTVPTGTGFSAQCGVRAIPTTTTCSPWRP